MKILIVGLGLIGGSTAKALRRAGIAADGMDRRDVEKTALAEGVIDSVCTDTCDYDVVIVALPPDAAMRFLDEVSFRENAIVADFCGVKGALEKLVFSKPRNYRYVGCHPMAGKEVSGFCNSSEALFDGASMIITENSRTDPQAVSLLKGLYDRFDEFADRIIKERSEYAKSLPKSLDKNEFNYVTTQCCGFSESGVIYALHRNGYLYNPSEDEKKRICTLIFLN